MNHATRVWALVVPIVSVAAVASRSQAQSPFIRGDVDADGSLQLTDATLLFDHLFRGQPATDCVDALDADASGRINLTDAVQVLGFLFSGGPPPAPPFPSCALPTATAPALGCERHAACADPLTVVPAKELMVTDLSVVEDPCRTRWDANGDAEGCDEYARGAWTFGKLMATLAGLGSIDEDPRALSDFVLAWLRQLEADQEVNGFTARGRPGVCAFIADWVRASGFNDPRDPEPILDLHRAPFRLLAIVSRLDLRRPGPAGEVTNAGEGRFVFGMLAIDPSAPDDPDCWSPLPATVILEYSLGASSAEDIAYWAESWHSLGSLRFGEEYNTALQAITDAFTGPGAAPERPGGSALAQLRTNEIAFGDEWELREFHLVSAPPQDGDPPVEPHVAPRVELLQAPVAQTMDSSFNGSDRLARFLASQADRAREGAHVVPLEFEGEPFRAASALVSLSGSVWFVSGFSCTEERHQLSLSTCNGCHAGETRTRFVHVSPRAAGEPARLSRFLTGGSVADPTCVPCPAGGGGWGGDPRTVDCVTVRRFSDLERRAADLRELLSAGSILRNSSPQSPAPLFATASAPGAVH
jgi:hypothetical protein